MNGPVAEGAAGDGRTTGGVALATGTGAVADGVAVTIGGTVGDAEATSTGGGEALGVAVGDAVVEAVEVGAVATAGELGDGAALVGVELGFVEDATGWVADFVGVIDAVADSIAGSPRLPNDDHRPNPTIASASKTPPIKIPLRARASCGATAMPGGASDASSAASVVAAACGGEGCG